MIFFQFLIVEISVFYGSGIRVRGPYADPRPTQGGGDDVRQCGEDLVGGDSVVPHSVTLKERDKRGIREE